MDYSIQAYIERQATERLEKFLEDYYEGRLDADYTYAIPYIEYVLGKRKQDGTI